MHFIQCFECDEEFKVQSYYETQAPVAFCPYCGSELDIVDDPDLDDEEEDEDEDIRH